MERAKCTSSPPLLAIYLFPFVGVFGVVSVLANESFLFSRTGTLKLYPKDMHGHQLLFTKRENLHLIGWSITQFRLVAEDANKSEKSLKLYGSN